MRRLIDGAENTINDRKRAQLIEILTGALPFSILWNNTMKKECKKVIEHFIQCETCMNLVKKIVLSTHSAKLKSRRKRNVK